VTALPDIGGRMVYVTSGASTIGHLLSRGPQGFEAYDTADKSLGIFPTQKEAIAALMRV
jgi:hypothetical protein